MKILDRLKKLEPVTIVCIGDSTTSMEWCHPNWVDWINFTLRQGLPDELDEKGYTRKVINSGRDSGTVGHFLDNYEWEIGRFKPNLVIMSFGFNHLETENAGSLDIEAKKLIEKIQADGSEMVIWSTYATIKPDLTTKLEAVSRRWRLIAERNNCLFVDIFDEFRKLDLTDFFTYHYQWKNEVWNLEPGDIDFLHTNVRGNKLIAKVLLEKIFDLPILEWEDVGTMN